MEEELIGGYHDQFVEKQVPSNYKCLLCEFPARDPHRASCCNSIYCHSCLDQLLVDSSEFTCQAPDCQKRSNRAYLFDSDREADEQIRSLEIFCNKKDDGCKWKGPLKDKNEHYETCDYREIPCTNGCEAMIGRYQLDDHRETDCPKRIINCPHCIEKEGEHCFILGEHLDECPGYPISCPNNDCPKEVKRHEMPSHRAECPQEMVRCPYASIGCHMPFFRCRVKNHEEIKMEDHLQLARDRIVFLEKYHNPIAPLKLKLDSYNKRKEDNKEWYSPGFYTSPGGYKICLKIHSNGTGDGCGTHISYFICRMPGEYDDTLEWPFKGEVTVELLNQLEDDNHHMYMYDRKYTKKLTLPALPVGKHYGDGFGIPKFINHDRLELYYRFGHGIQYLKDDSLYFRVTVNTQSKTCTWLA